MERYQVVGSVRQPERCLAVAMAGSQITLEVELLLQVMALAYVSMAEASDRVFWLSMEQLQLKVVAAGALLLLPLFSLLLVRWSVGPLAVAAVEPHIVI
jgi:hypothetical protein